jgi:hypothetical protein
MLFTSDGNLSYFVQPRQSRYELIVHFIVHPLKMMAHLLRLKVPQNLVIHFTATRNITPSFYLHVLMHVAYSHT